MTVRIGNFGVEIPEDEYYRMKQFVFDYGWFFDGYERVYNNYEFDSLQIIFRQVVTEIDDEGVYHMSTVGTDTHIRGKAVWELRSRGIDLTPEDGVAAEKRGCFSDAKTGRGLVVVNLVNADVIPSYRKDEIIKMQVAFFPDWLSYYDSEEDIKRDADQNPDRAIRLQRELGEVSAVGLRFARSRQADEDIDKVRWEAVTDVKAVIKKVSFESTQISEVTKGEYVRCTVDTEFGPLEIVHGIDMVAEEEREKIKEGNIVFATGIISADPAIYEYENGIVKDEANNFKLMCDVFEGGDPERLRAVLADDAVYASEFAEDAFEGPDAILDRIRFVQENSSRYFAGMGTIISVDEGEGEAPAEEGQRCIVLSAKQEGNYESAAFLEMNEEGEIVRISTSADPRLHFRVDPPLEEVPTLYEYDPDGISVTPTFAGIGLDRYFAFGSEMDRFLQEETRTGKLTWSYDHNKAYDVRHENDICYITEYDADHERKRFLIHSEIPLGNSDRSIWDALIAMQPKVSDPDYRKQFVVLRRKTDGKGIAVLKLVEAGLYPSYMEDEEIRIRVTAFPHRMEYFGTEEEMEKSMRREDGSPIDLVADGVIMPIAFFGNHTEAHRNDAQRQDRDFDDDHVNIVRGVVKEILPGRIPTLYGNETHFVKCYISTHFGEMEILHTEEMISGEQRKNMKPGAIVYGAFGLYGNPAFGEYEYGVVGNEENDLRKLREVLVTGDAEELFEILDDDAEIAFDGEEEPGVKGRRDVIRYLQNSYDLIETRSSADMATVEKVDVDGRRTMLPGRRCIAFAEAAGEAYTSIWSIETNDEGNIVRITYGLCDGYGLKIDPKPVFCEEDLAEAESNGVH